MRNTRREPHHDTTRASAAGDDRLFIQFPIHESDSIKQKSARHAQAQGGNEKNRPRINQPSSTIRQKQSHSKYETAID
jgi:hypothetical protein